MALADPQPIKVGAAAIQQLPRLTLTSRDGTFANPEGALSLLVAHSNGTKGTKRHLISLKAVKIAADPLTATNMEVAGTVHVVFNTPRTGFSTQEQVDQLKALLDWLSADTFANAKKVIGGES